VETNISEHTIRKVLSQIQEEKWKLITFLLRTIQAAKKNYKIYNKELLDIVLWQPLVTKTNRNTNNKSQRQISLWESQENLTRSLCCIPILFIQKFYGLC